ncbi:uncharacterized protein LOC113351629 [Papaver somniferum]|uniref:uncharacterized protein LOC113351629 n=1 Tax=Papaver somniferum TaxID=3469 RepID=UPI000E6F8BB6|nr:uncharacterized protein LOC113351629 [Papaver somniferum]
MNIIVVTNLTYVRVTRNVTLSGVLTRKVNLVAGGFMRLSLPILKVCFSARRLTESMHVILASYDPAKVRMTKSFLKDILIDEFRASYKKKTAADVKDLLHLEYGIDLSYSQAYHGLQFTKESLWGDDIKSYSDFVWYKDSIECYNPGSIVNFEYVGETKQFQRFFVAFEASIISFNNYCRPMLFIDCTFLTGKFKGGLMVACGTTGNQEIYPVDFGIVPCENCESWEWFLTNLKGIIREDRPLTIISDHGAGILKRAPIIFPKDYYSYCLYHMKDGKDSIRELGSSCFSRKRFGENTSNIAESFNSVIKHDKRLPALELVDCIRAKVMEKNYKRLVESSKWNSILTPRMQARLKKRVTDCRFYKFRRSSDKVFEIISPNGKHMVDLDARTCTCNWWQKHSFPCTHSMKAMLQIGPDKPYKHISPYYTTEYYGGLYARPIYPILDHERPPKINEKGYVLPPCDAPNTKPA